MFDHFSIIQSRYPKKVGRPPHNFEFGTGANVTLACQSDG
jgi:hypothetical protein